MAWRDNEGVHFASDSRLTFGHSYADIGIKVLSLPYRIYDPAEPNENRRTVAFSGELGMCFAGSTINSLIIKESIVEVLKGLQYVPGYTDTSMESLSKFIFTAYKLISQRICETDIGTRGRADIIISGYCTTNKVIRTFLLSTSPQNIHSCQEILTENNSSYFIGDGSNEAKQNVPQHATSADYLNILKMVIDDSKFPTVGGNVQYGEFQDQQFIVFGIWELKDQVHYWRGALDLNCDAFSNDSSSLIPGVPYIDPFSTLGV